jgi:integrase
MPTGIPGPAQTSDDDKASMIREAKTDAGVRSVDAPLALRELLADHKARHPRVGPGDPVFPNRAGRRQTVSNVERRLKTVVRRANQRLAELGIQAISEDVTPHSLRRLYASLRFALGDDPVYVAAQLGHTEPAFSMKVYAQAVRRRERLTGTALREFDRALQWADMGRIEPAKAVDRPSTLRSESAATAQSSREPATSPDSSAG